MVRAIGIGVAGIAILAVAWVGVGIVSRFVWELVHLGWRMAGTIL